MGNLSSHSKCNSEEKVETQKIINYTNAYCNYSPTNSIYGPGAFVNYTKKNNREHRGQIKIN